MISITIDAHNATEARAQMAELLGTTLIFAEPDETKIVTTFAPQSVDPAALTEVGERIAETQASAHVAQGTKRQVGQPAPGKARRTKAEIAEDDAFLAGVNSELQALKPEPDEPVIEDSPEVQAADAADEAAETAAAKVDGKLTLDDVRNALGLYVGAFGMAAAQADGPVLIAKVLGVEHNPAAPKKISDLGDDQVLLRRAVDGVAEMIAKDPFKRGSAVAS